MAKFYPRGVIWATLALAAIFPATSHAGVYEAENNQYPTTISGQQIAGTVTSQSFTKLVITTHAGNVQCSNATFSGAVYSQSSLQRLIPSLSGCTLAGVGASVAFNGCEYLVVAGETEGGGADKVRNALSLSCPSGKAIEIKSANCLVSISGAGGLNQALTLITTENQTAATPFMNIKANIDIHSLAYSTNAKCPNDGGIGGNFYDGTYKGVALLSSSSRGITVT